MHKLFDAEMQLLHEEAQRFSDAYPGEARQLNLRSLKDRDPYVERLLEGMAFLTAQVKARIEDDLPEIAETFIRQNCPTLLQILPGAFIAQFDAIGSFPEIHFFPKGTEIKSQVVGPDNIECGFRTTSDFEYLPLKLVNVLTHSNDIETTIIKLSFQIEKSVNLLKNPIKSIPFYIHANADFSLTLYHALLTSVKTVSLKLNLNDVSINLGDQIAIQPCYLYLRDTLLPSLGKVFDGFNLLLDYFAFLEKFLFFKIENLEKINWPSNVSSFDVEILMQPQLHQSYHLTSKNLLLNCIPMVNLYKYVVEPINVTQKKYEYPVIADVSSKEGIQIQSIDSVQGIQNSQYSYEYTPLYNFEHDENHFRYFSIFQRHVKGCFPQHYITLSGKNALHSERLSCVASVNNGYYPRDYFTEFTFNGKSQNVPKNLRVTNVTRPSSWLMSPHYKGYLWSFVSYLSLNIDTLSDSVSLKKCLSMFDWSARDDNLKKREAIQAVKVRTMNVIHQGALSRIILYHLTLDESGFLNLGDVFLFGKVLHHFLSIFISLNFSVKTIIQCYPSEEIFSFEPLVGLQCPI